jgi:hypothetical protein
MTTAVLLRSGMMRKYHVPFWRATGGVTHLLTLIIAGSEVIRNRGLNAAGQSVSQNATYDFNDLMITMIKLLVGKMAFVSNQQSNQSQSKYNHLIIVENACGEVLTGIRNVQYVSGLVKTQ